MGRWGGHSNQTNQPASPVTNAHHDEEDDEEEDDGEVDDEKRFCENVA